MKKILILCALCALVAVAVACGDQADTPSDTTLTQGEMADSSEISEPLATTADSAQETMSEPEKMTDEMPTKDSHESPTEEPTEAPTEEVTQDPMELCKPTHLITPKDLHRNAVKTGNANYCQQIQSATVTDQYITLTCSGSDPYVAALRPGTRDAVTTKLLAIKYRTVDDSQGELFIGEGSGWTGQGDRMSYSYIPDGEWHLLLLDLSGLSSLGQRNASYLRFDFFTDGSAGRSIDVQYLAFFETPEQAEMYDGLVSRKDTHDSTFTSDVTAQTDGTSLKDADFGQYFANSQVESSSLYAVKNGLYVLSGTGNALTSVNGIYAMTVDMKKADGDAFVAARLVGDTGIYAKVSEGQFVLVINCKDGTHRYALPVEGTELTLADNGDVLFFVVNGKLVASVAFLGNATCDDTGDSIYAATAYIRFSDGSAGKLSNTLVSAYVNAPIGFVVGAGEMHLASVKVQAPADISIPAFEKTDMNLKDDLAVSDYWIASVEELGTIPNPDVCTVKQGGWTDGVYYYQLFIKKDTASDEENNIAKLVKYDMKTGEVVKTSDDLGLNHANDLTYNPKRNIFVAVHNNPNRKKLSIIDPETFEIVDTVTLECKIFSLDYNEERDQYVIGIAGGQTFRILNADFTYADDVIHQPTTLSKGYTTQGVSCDENYIYFVLYNQNCITVYDWDGNFICYIKLNISGEPENLSAVGNEIYISSAHDDGAHIFRISDWQKELKETEA